MDRRRVMAVATVTMAFVVGCGGGGDGDNETHNIPPGAFGFISEQQLDALAAMGFPINTGLMPPNVQGSFYADALVRTGGNIPNDQATAFNDTALDFTGQTAENSVMVSYAQGREMGSGLGSFVSGSGNAFTIFTQIAGTGNGIAFKSAMLYSGTMTAEGIQGFDEAVLLTSKDPDPDAKLISVGQTRILAENDDLVDRVLANRAE